MSEGSTIEGGGVEVWRGGVNTWECDEMGHMNVRFYVVKATEALAGLAAHLGLPHAFGPGGGSTLIVREHHIRFLREAHAGGALHIEAGVLEMAETEARILMLMRHSRTGELAATVQAVVAHATPDEGTAFPWSARTRERAQALMVDLPPQAAARSVSLAPIESQASLARADDLRLQRIGLGAVGPQDCDPFGRMRAEQFIGRVSDGIPNLIGPLRDVVAETQDAPPARYGGAVLEYRLIYLDWPRLGDRIELRSGVVGAEDKVQRLVHWLLDPETGKAWGTSEAVAVTLDLDARKIVPITPEARVRIAERSVAGLTL